MTSVLVVDDSRVMRNLLRKILDDMDGVTNIIEATNGKEALDIFKKENPKIITMDIVMPEMNGLDTAKEILKEDSSVRIVMVSALGHEDVVCEAIKEGAADFIVKPFSSENVTKVIGKFI